MGSTRKWVTNPPGQRENWGAIEHTNEGRRVRNQANQIVTRMTRFGQRIQLHQLASVPKNFTETALLEEVEKKINQEKAGKSSSKKLQRLEAAKKVLTTSLQLRTHLRREPSMYHVLGAIGLIYGFKSAEIEAASRHMAVAKVSKHPTTWEGDVTSIRKALTGIIDSDRNNYVTGTEQKLHSIDNSLTSRQLAQKLGLEWTRKNKILLNSTLQLLETAGIVKKMPLFVDLANHTQLSVWVHREHKPTTKAYEILVEGKKHYLSVPMELLSQLSHGKRLSSELYREKISKEKYGEYKIGSKEAFYDIATVSINFKSLQNAGLITVRDIQVQRTKGGTPIVKEVELTKLGKELWEYTIRTGVLSDRLRILLLGEKEK